MIVWQEKGSILFLRSARSVGLLLLSALPIGRRSISTSDTRVVYSIESVEMKIEANLTPEQLKWIILVILIAAGLGHEQILGLLA